MNEPTPEHLDVLNQDLYYLATCALEAVADLDLLAGLDDGYRGDVWARAHEAVMAALQEGLRHLAQEAGETKDKA